MPRNSSSWSRIEALFLLYWRRFRNSLSAAYGNRKGLRKATKSKGKSGGGAAITLFLTVVFLLQGFVLTKSTLQNFVNEVRDVSLHQDPTVMEVNRQLHRALKSYRRDAERGVFKNPREDLQYLDTEEYLSREFIDLPDLTLDEVLNHYEEYGFDGFQKVEYFSKKDVRIRGLAESEKEHLQRLVGLVLLLTFVALLCMPLAVRARDLAQSDDSLEWLFSMPLKGWEILAGNYLSMVVLRPLAYIALWPLLTNLFVAQHMEWPIAACLALIFAMLSSVALSGVEMFLDSWIRSRCSAKVRKNVQMFLSVSGMLSFYMLVAAVVVSSSFVWVDWLASRLPEFLILPLGRLFLLPLEGGTLNLASVVGVAAVIVGAGGCWLAGRVMNTGLLSGANQESSARSLAGTRLKDGSLLRFEGLLLLRDRALATQVILVPLLLIGYQLMVNPDVLTDITALGISGMAFGCGAYASVITAPQVLMSEARSIWLIYNLPVSIAAYFRRREFLWRCVATCMTFLLVLSLSVWKSRFEPSDLLRYLSAIIGVAVVGRLVSAIVMGQPKMPDLAAGERPRPKTSLIYGAMLMAGAYGGLLMKGDLWPMVSLLVIYWFLGTALWQKREISFNYLLEPTEQEPKAWGVADGLWAVVVFFIGQVLSALVFLALDFAPMEVITYSFISGGLIAMLATTMIKQKKGIPLPEWEKAESPGIIKETLLATAACLMVAFVWVWFYQSSAIFDGYRETQESPFGAGDVSPYLLLLLAVVAAPLIEEPLFRGFVCRTMLGFWSRKQAIFASALVFAIVHPGSSFPPVFLVGICTAVLYSRSGSIVPGIILHALYNLGMISMQL